MKEEKLKVNDSAKLITTTLFKLDYKTTTTTITTP